jgi:hypothetical protein
MPEAFVCNTKSTRLSQFQCLYVFHTALLFSDGVSSTDVSRAWTLVSSCRSWFSSHRSWDANWFCKQSAIALAPLFGWYVIPKGCLLCNPFHKGFLNRPQSLRCDLTVFYFCFRRSSTFLRVTRLMVLATQLTAVLHAGSRVTYLSLLDLRLCFSRLSRPGRSLLRSEIVIFIASP